MKKIYILITILLLSTIFTSCDKNSDGNNEEEKIYYNNPFERLDYNLASIKLDKDVYELDDEINVEIYNAKSTDYIGLFPFDGEPDNSLPYKRIKVGTDKKLSFSISQLGLSQGEYCVCLYQNKTFYLLDRVELQIDNDDHADYKIKEAKLISSNENRILKTSLIITPSTDKELTYTAYWSKDGKRLEEYTDLAKVTHKGYLDIKIDFNENMYMPNEANEIEVAVTEGKSSSYFLKVDDTLKLEKSIYKFNYQIMSDIHANQDYGFWSSHFYRALLDVKCLAGNTSGIFTTGDNTDMGSTAHYSYMFEIIESVFGKEAPEMYFTVGNHDYMYFSESIGGFDKAIEYFIDTTGMENSYRSMEFMGHKCIFLSSDEKCVEGRIYQEQLDWFKEELKTIDKQEFAFIFIHQPLYDTVSGSLPGQNWYGMPNVQEEIKLLLKDYPNVVMFSGHTHYSLESYKSASFGHGENANYVNNAAVAYLMNDDYDYTVGGMCNFIEVYEDYLLIKGRDLFEGKWVSNAQFVCYLY